MGSSFSRLVQADVGTVLALGGEPHRGSVGATVLPGLVPSPRFMPTR
jgi:hypothetical protein